MTVATSWKRKAPLLLAVTAIVGLAAVTAWVRQSRIDIRADDVRTVTDSAPAVGTSKDDAGSSQSRASRRTSTDARLHGADMQERVNAIIARRARVRDEAASKAEASKQKAMAAYRAEKIDRAWAAQKETELSGVATSEALAQAKIVPKSFDVDCKTTVCRLNGTFSTLSEAEDWTLYYMSSVGNALPNTTVSKTQNPDGTTNVEIYGRAR